MSRIATRRWLAVAPIVLMLGALFGAWAAARTGDELTAAQAEARGLDMVAALYPDLAALAEQGATAAPLAANPTLAPL
ncbi:MAG TPA: hypothetical protein GYA10_07115, partial [Alphaproteobacteria bacterium]|nr:hypothetical protein [Alphaproteobacteria bacterium]